jgi:T-complex protein 1 subunit theta
VFGGELLTLAEHLLRMGLHPPDIIAGYELGRDYALKALDGIPYMFRANVDLAVDKVADIKSEPEIAKAIKTTIASKQYGNEGFLSKLVAKAVLAVMPKNPMAFNVDNIRVVKIMGGGLEDSDVVKGMVFSREPSGICRLISLI